MAEGKPRREWLVVKTVLSFGLNLMMRRLRLDPRWKWLLWGVIAINELRGLAVVWLSGGALLKWAGS